MKKIAKAFNDTNNLPGVLPSSGQGASLHENFSAQATNELSPLEKVAKLLAGHDISEKVEKTLERAMNGSAQAQKDLWYFINNRLGGVPKNEELWQAGFELLQDSAARGNKQAISDLAYVRFHGLHGIKADPEGALESMKKIGYATKYDAFERWQPGYKKAHGITEAQIEAEQQEQVEQKTEEGLKKHISADQIDSLVEKNGFDPEDCMKISVPGGGQIIDCTLKDALLKQGVQNPDECNVEFKGPDRGYIVICPPAAPMP